MACILEIRVTVEYRKLEMNINEVVILMVPCIVTLLIRFNKMQQYAGTCLLHIYSSCFGCPSHPSSGAHETVNAASGTGHTNSATTFLQRDLIRPRWRKVVTLLLLTCTRRCS